MEYPLLIISRVETDNQNRLVVLTFFPSNAACIKPRPYETLSASYVRHFQPGVELADAVSEKGKHRLKILMRRPGGTDDERRSLGTMYYSQFFGGSPGGDENKKGAADALYYTMCDLHKADVASEEAWAAACDKAVAAIQRLAGQHFA